jgi:hypothetical protein
MYACWMVGPTHRLLQEQESAASSPHPGDGARWADASRAGGWTTTSQVRARAAVPRATRAHSYSSRCSVVNCPCRCKGCDATPARLRVRGRRQRAAPPSTCSRALLLAGPAEQQPAAAAQEQEQEQGQGGQQGQQQPVMAAAAGAAEAAAGTPLLPGVLDPDRAQVAGGLLGGLLREGVRQQRHSAQAHLRRRRLQPAPPARQRRRHALRRLPATGGGTARPPRRRRPPAQSARGP